MTYDILTKEQNVSGDWSVSITIKDSNGDPIHTFGRLFDYEPTEKLLDDAVQGFLQYVEEAEIPAEIPVENNNPIAPFAEL